MAFLKKRTAYKKTSFIIDPEYKHSLYDVSSKGHSIFRIFPSPVEGASKFEAQIVPVDENALTGLSNSFCEVESVSWFGKEKLSLITTCSDINEEEQVSPALAFYNAIDDFVKAEVNKAKRGEPVCEALYEWSPWFDKKGIASLPRTTMMLQGVLIEHAGELCKDSRSNKVSPRMPVVLCLNRSATMDFEDKLTTRLREGDDISAENSEIGDVTSLENGAAIKVESYKNKDNQIRYTVTVARGRDDKPVIVPLQPSLVLAQFVPWEKLLNIQPAAWQIEKLIEQFCPEAVDYALGDDSLYGPMLPDDVRGTFKAKFMGEKGEESTPAASVKKSAESTKKESSEADGMAKALAALGSGEPSQQDDDLDAVEPEVMGDDIPHVGAKTGESSINEAIRLAMATAKASRNGK